MQIVSENQVVAEKLNVIFHAMADTTRRNILLRLTQGEMNAGEVAKPYKMSLPAVSKHLKVLEKSNLISRRKQGKEHIFSLKQGAMEDATNWMKFYERLWNANLDNLEKFLKKS